MLYVVLKRARSNLNLRYLPGTYLGTTLDSNECWIATASGNVTRARSIIRLREDRRWSMDMVQKIVGTPMHPNPLDEAYDVQIESDPKPHENRDDGLREQLDGEPQPDRQTRRLKITRKDHETYGFTENCPRCDAIQMGDFQTNKNHTETCTERIYTQMRLANDPNWVNWQR